MYPLYFSTLLLRHFLPSFLPFYPHLLLFIIYSAHVQFSMQYVRVFAFFPQILLFWVFVWVRLSLCAFIEAIHICVFECNMTLSFFLISWCSSRLDEGFSRELSCHNERWTQDIGGKWENSHIRQLLFLLSSEICLWICSLTDKIAKMCFVEMSTTLTQRVKAVLKTFNLFSTDDDDNDDGFLLPFYLRE